MKIVAVDNYDSGKIRPKVIEQGLTKEQAESKADALNEMEDEYSPIYYMVKDEDYDPYSDWEQF